MDILKLYDPVLVGTIPINIDIESSDLDIICFVTDKYEFKKFLLNQFGNKEGFSFCETEKQGQESIVANFFLDGFQIEVFGQNTPTHLQVAYKHMLVKYEIIKEKGEEFRRQVIQLKQQGIKTEPAFGILLGMDGDPYVELLKILNQNNQK